LLNYAVLRVLLGLDRKWLKSIFATIFATASKIFATSASVFVTTGPVKHQFFGKSALFHPKDAAQPH